MAIQFKGSNIPGVSPLPEELDERELGINTTDKKLFTKDSSGDIIEIGQDNINTGLETPTLGGGTHEGHRYINLKDPAAFLALGIKSTDLSYGSLGVQDGTIGAGAENSFTAGIDTTVTLTGTGSFAIGNTSKITGINGIILGHNTLVGDQANILTIGNDNIVGGANSVTVGKGNNNGSNTIPGGIVFGIDNILNVAKTDTTKEEILIGKGLVSSGVTEFGNIVIGRYNISNIDTSENQFTIANGDSGSPKNIFSIGPNGEAILDSIADLISIDNNPKALVTSGYLADPNTAGVSSVNGFVGTVILEPKDIEDGTLVGNTDRLWMNANERAQLVDLPGNLAAKNDLLINPAIPPEDGLALVSDINSTTGYIWTQVASDGITINFTELTDTPLDYVGAADYHVRVNQAGDALIFEELTRDSGSLALNIPNVGIPEEATFDLSINGINWPASTQVQEKLDFKEDLLPGPIFGSAANSYHRYVLQVSDATQDPEDNTQVLAWTLTVVPDFYTAQEITYDNSISTLTAINTQVAIDELDGKISSISNGDMLKSVYDTNNSGIVDNAELVNGLSVLTAVPLSAVFTDTVYDDTTIQGEVDLNTANITIIQDNLSGGKQSLNYISLTTGATVSSGDYIFADSTASIFTITLPAGIIGETIYIHDIAASFLTNNVSVVPNGSETIMGLIEYTLSADNSKTEFIYTGTDWRVITAL